MASIADIAVSLTAQTAGFETNIERAAKKSKSAFKSMSDDIAFFGNAVKAGVAGFRGIRSGGVPLVVRGVRVVGSGGCSARCRALRPR